MTDIRPSRELVTLRDHARRMADQAEVDRPTSLSSPCRYPGWLGLTHDDCGLRPEACGCSCHDAERSAPPTDVERVLWTQIADEIDDYIAAPVDDGQGMLI